MIRIRQIKVIVTNNSEEVIKEKIAKRLKIKSNEILDYKINKEAIDARKSNEIFYVYEVDVILKNEEYILNNIKDKDIFKTPNEEYIFPKMGVAKLNHKPIIVGSGPAGLFAAYLLSEMGYKPLIIERGKMVDDRLKSVEEFWQTGKLNLESNVQFGEGGAGTFSDGKLNTLIKDKEHIGKKIMDIFIENGAPKDIAYVHNPHIGTDLLRDVIKNIRQKIINQGGIFRYNTKLTDIIIENNKITKIVVNDKEIIDCDILILAIGHSARDTIKMLYDNGLKMQPKAFAIGVRIMHEQDMINTNQYGKFKDYLPNASYKLTYTTTKGRGVYSFCMCPGGYVINASSELNCLAINGMSPHSRDSGVANSAIVVNFNPNDLNMDVLSSIEYQRKLESFAYKLGNGNIPLQRWEDYKKNKPTTALGKLHPMVKGKYLLTNIRESLPDFINEALLEAIPYFGTKIKGFDDNDTLLAIIESRTSSPITILRDENKVASIQGIYPVGEGAGYAGGITSAAIDGIKTAEVIIKKYHN